MTSTIHDLFDGLELETKVCNQCGIEKTLSCYGNNSGAKHLRSKCRDCEKAQVRQRNQFKTLVPPYNHRCEICQRTEEECTGEGGKKVGTWCLDHNHETGEFRGWLCHSCNRALGNFKDSIDLLRAAIAYLEKA